MTTKQRLGERYLAQNLACARIIASNPMTYPDGSLPALWACLVLRNAEAVPADSEAGPLFESRAA